MQARAEPGTRLCENPVFGEYWLHNLLILFDRNFEKSTFHTVSHWSRRPEAYASP